MKRILFWTMIPPLNSHTQKEILAGDLVGSNTGNVLFHHSVVRTLLTDEEIEPEYYFGEKRKDFEAFVRHVNEECSYFIIPLANAFRIDYVQLEPLTEFIKRLTIPCVVVGVGVQVSDLEVMRRGFSIDDKVRNFVKAVLDHSAMLGIRGEITGEYLKQLGFREEEHFRVIGCPAMYLFGADLPKIEKKTIDAQSLTAINGKIANPDFLHEWMKSACQTLPNFWYIPQHTRELWLMTCGLKLPHAEKRRWIEYIPVDTTSPVLAKGRSVGFLNVPTWLEFMKDMDFSYGCNIHGNMAALLAGVPALVLERDYRVAELANYFEIPMLSKAEIQKGVGVLEAYEKADYSALYAHHGQRFERFVDFLNLNGLDHIYKNGGSVPEAPYDRRLAQIRLAPPVYAKMPITLAQRLDALPIYKKAGEYYWFRAEQKIKRKVEKKLKEK